MAAQVPDTPTVIQIAKICQYLYNRALSKNRFYNGQQIDPNRPVLLYITRKDVEYLYNTNPSDAGLFKVASYLFGLCAPFIQQALQIINNLSASAPVITGPANQSVNVGGNATFSVSVVGSGPFTYQWYDFNGSPISGATSSSYTLPNAQLTDSGHTFFVRVVDSNGKSATSSVATLTVTAVIIGQVYYGDMDYSTDLSNGIDNVPYIFTFNITHNAAFPIQFPVPISSKFIVIKYPNTEPVKNHYDNPPIDNGPIPGFAINSNSFGSSNYAFSRNGNPFTLNASNILTLSTI